MPKNNLTSFVLGIGLLALSVLSIGGLIYLTKFGFKSDDVGDVRTVKLTKFEMNITRVTLVLMWINIALGVLSGLNSIANGR